jgi:PTH1 family peptidyl-tRNA hydrolase
MHLLVGLGNIGPEYEQTRHNFGFLTLDQIIEDYHLNKISAKKFHSEIFAGEIFGKKVIAIKPQTFMNRSGIAVSETSNFYKIEPENILVFHDEVDLVLG